jgi:prepilin-type processing-associated H-X9-DG protein
VVVAMLAAGTTFKVWYDPGDSGNMSANLYQLWTNWQNNGYTQVGYAQTFPGTASYGPYTGSGGGVWDFETNLNYKLSSTAVSIPPIGSTPEFNFTIALSSRPQVSCEMVTSAGATDVQSKMMSAAYAWNGLIGGDGGPYPYNTSHMKNASLPAGVNIGMLDGHAEWRPFTSPLVLPRAGSGAGDAPFYYY